MGSKNIFLAIFTHDVVLSSVWLPWNAVGREPTERILTFVFEHGLYSLDDMMPSANTSFLLHVDN